MKCKNKTWSMVFLLDWTEVFTRNIDLEVNHLISKRKISTEIHLVINKKKQKQHCRNICITRMRQEIGNRFERLYVKASTCTDHSVRIKEFLTINSLKLFTFHRRIIAISNISLFKIPSIWKFKFLKQVLFLLREVFELCK